ncbi:APC family permease [Rhodococcus kronopolitis]|uniref:APC family permease n=1 Tax=Rhodococcus kronopolitis TaxID=1460226 RepID=A0ABV9FXI5_9NOCA
MTALAEAIARSFAAGEPDRPALSPLRALGRRQLTGYEVLAQSVATTAPAASMVLLPVTMLTHETLLAGLVTIIAATVFITVIAWCVSQFTRRLAASGGLYTFVFQGLGTRAALTTGVAMLVKYLGSGALTLYHGGQALIALCAQLGVEVRGPGAALVYLGVAAAILAALVRGVRFAAVAILAVEICSLMFIVGLMLVSGASDQVALIPPDADGHGLLPVILTALFALAGFESATFFGPEARRPMVTVTRTVLATPVICGALFVFAGWAAWSGRADNLANAYLHGSSTGVSPVVVVALNLGLSCSWLASAMASSNAASRLLYSMGVERVLPRALAHVHRGWRTPHLALVAAVAAIATAAPVFTVVDGAAAEAKVGLRVALLIAYVLVALATVRFLGRIGELTAAARLAGRLGAASGLVTLAYIVGFNALDGGGGGLAAAAAAGTGALAWQWYLGRARPRSLAAVGVFDSPESADVLPGAGVFAVNARGAVALVGTDRPGRVGH